jgi:hypothetical protein
MSNVILRLSAAAVIAGMLALAQAQSSVSAATPLIAITSFTITHAYSPGTVGTDLEEAPQLVADDVSVQFTNTGSVPATSVRFLIDDGRFTQVIVDKGTFSPGVQIKHDFAIPGGLDTHPNAACRVVEVDLANGSVWRAASNGVAAR